ncbi:MAG: 5-(carboxyamino)imidazole ribonucleotide mutase [Actinomycetota bacterium]|nr:5-(carboxyamino)imidazole ribonucleotide mutase [Actinomycetota bacterium]
MARPLVAVVMGSSSDLKTMVEAVDMLETFDIPHEEKIISAHRGPKALHLYIDQLRARRVEVIIAGAGKAAHLPGVIASLTTAPVIGVPMVTSDLGGLDSLLSIVQMPKGVPVATVAIGGAANAAILAAQILGLKHPAIAERLARYKDELAAPADTRKETK